MYRLWCMQRDITSQVVGTRPNLLYVLIEEDLGVRDENMRKISLCILLEKNM